MFTYLFGGFGGRRDIFLTVSASQADYDLFAEAGSPTDPVNVFVTVESATVLYGSTTGLPGFKTGTGWLTNTELTLINEGHIVGMGGDGGEGASHVYVSQGDCSGVTQATVGLPGGDAMTLEWDITIDNTNGNIWSGGGGAAGSGCGRLENQVVTGGGGGGGGAGGNLTAVSSGGLGGTSSGATTSYQGCDGEDGSGGASGDGGRQGATDQLGSCPQYGSTAGGVYGADGTTTSGLCPSSGNDGGAAGKAIELGGYTVTWEGGSSSPNVEGAVS